MGAGAWCRSRDTSLGVINAVMAAFGYPFEKWGTSPPVRTGCRLYFVVVTKHDAEGSCPDRWAGGGVWKVRETV